ncbi:hypothetical protein GCM10010402_87430 [Actinomadura luteofluorescens]
MLTDRGEQADGIGRPNIATPARRNIAARSFCLGAGGQKQHGAEQCAAERSTIGLVRPTRPFAAG